MPSPAPGPSSRSIPAASTPHPARRPGGTGDRGNSFANGPKGAMHRWPCSCQWCMEGTVPEQAG